MRSDDGDKRQSPAPLVSIGMPVYNSERTITAALDSIVSQSFTDFELIISDNASTDSTGAICTEYASRDHRIQYIRQPMNQGATENFRFVLSRARGEFFMWAAGDDIRSPDFIAANIAFLEEHPDFVASTSPVRFESGGFDEVRMGDGALDGDRTERLLRFFQGWHANGRFYSLMRTAVIKECAAVGQHFLGSDWAIVLFLAAHGRMHRTEKGWMVLGAHGLSNSGRIFREFRTEPVEWLIPFYQFGRFLLTLSRGTGLRARSRIAGSLVAMNVRANVARVKLSLRNASYRYGQRRCRSARQRET